MRVAVLWAVLVAACLLGLAGLAAHLWRRLGELSEEHLFCRLFDPMPYGRD